MRHVKILALCLLMLLLVAPTGTGAAPRHVSSATRAVAGSVFTDRNANGRINRSDTGLAGVTVNLYKKGEAASSSTTRTGRSGAYLFSNLPAGVYTVRVTLPAGYQASLGASRDVAVTASTQVITVNFGVYLPATVSGMVWNDTNTNGKRDAGEGGIPDIAVVIAGRSPASPPVTVRTDRAGKYACSNLRPGTYTVAPAGAIGEGYRCTRTKSVSITLKSGESVDVFDRFRTFGMRWVPG